MPELDGPVAAGATLRLLDGWRLSVDGVEIRLNHREQRLTALLGLTGERSRALVAATLWPESTDQRALASLRRAVLATQRISPGLLVVDRFMIALETHVEVDVDGVRRAAAALDSATAPADDLATLRGGELLPGWYDDWVLAEREQLSMLQSRSLERVARAALEDGDLGRAIEAAHGVSDVEPFHEAACEIAINAHLAREDRGNALHEFRRYSVAMREELGAAPSARIRALVEPALVEPSPPRLPVVETPAPGPAVAHVRVPAPRVPAPRAAAHDHRPTFTVDDLLGASVSRPHRAVRILAGAVGALAGAALVVALAGLGTGEGADPVTRPPVARSVSPAGEAPGTDQTPKAPRRVGESSTRAPAEGHRRDRQNRTGQRRATPRPVQTPDPATAPSPEALVVANLVSEPVTTPGPEATQAPSPGPTPSPTPTSTPNPTPKPTPSPTQGPAQGPTDSPPKQPTDPGTVEPTPVG